MSHDKRKRIYTLTIIVRDTGRIADIQTYSSKKHAEERLAYLEEIYFGPAEKDGDENRRLFAITLSTSRLRRKARNMGQL